MAIAKAIEPQTDFSAGELNVDAKRTDDPLVKSGARQMSNWRILNSRKATNRPGKAVQFPTDGRVDEVLVDPDFVYRLCFGNGTLKIRGGGGGHYIAGNSGYAWTAATAHQIVWTLVKRSATQRDIVICFPGQIPKIARWTNVDNSWSFLDFSFKTNAYGAFQEPFYFLAPPDITMTPSDVKNQITVTVSSDYFTATMVGTVVRWLGKQIVLTAFTDAKNMTGWVLERLPDTISFSVTSVQGTFNVGDAIGTTTSPRQGYEGEVASVTIGGGGAVTAMTVNMFVPGQQFVAADVIVGPNGSATAGAITTVSPGASRIWDEEAMNGNRGWPASCFFDQNRLGFCNIPAVPGAIAWSSIGIYDSFTPGGNPSDPMFEIAPNRARVLHVANRSDEFVLTDSGIWYIPISSANPLKPGSVQFLKISSDAAADVPPVETVEGVIFVGAAGNRVVAIVPKFGFNIPWGTIETSLYHSHLFNSPVALALTTSDGNFQERYVYLLNGDGTLAIGKFDVAREWAGWLPWNGTGFVNWVSARSSSVMFTTTYTMAGTAVTVAELLDVAQYVDGGLLVNNPIFGMQATTDPNIQTLLTGALEGTTMTDHGAASVAFDGNFLKGKNQCVGIDSPVVGYGNRVWRHSGSGAQVLKRMRITGPLDNMISASGASAFQIVGSNDGVTWTPIYTGTTGTVFREQIDVTSGIGLTAYTYFGVDISGTASNKIAVAQIEFFYNAAGNTYASPSGGTGPLWWLAGGQAEIMDGVQTYGLHTIDASGNIVPIDAEDLSSPTLVAGLAWTATLEPFIQQLPGGADNGQRMRRRKIAKANVSVLNSTGFVFAGRRVPSWFTGENQELPPPLRENTYQFRPKGRSYDPRAALVKDTPGPLTVLEIGLEMTA